MPARRREGPSNGTITRVYVVLLGLTLAAYAAYRVRSVLLLVVVALFLAVGLDPAVRRLQKFGLRRGHAVAALFLSVVLVSAGFVAAVVPPLVSQVTNFASELPDYVEDLSKGNSRIAEFVQENDIASKLRDATTKIPSTIAGSLGEVMGVAGSVLGSIFQLVTVMVLTIYFLLSLANIREGTMQLVPRSRRVRFTQLMDPILEKIGGYIAGNVIVSVIAGVITFIFLTIAGVPFPVALGLWVAIADLIPLVGATLGAVPTVIVAFFVSLPVGIATLIFFVIYQQVENYVIAPRVMTKTVDISAAAVLLAVLVGGSLLGFVGALMAIPVAAAIKLVAQEVVIPRVDTA